MTAHVHLTVMNTGTADMAVKAEAGPDVVLKPGESVAAPAKAEEAPAGL